METHRCLTQLRAKVFLDFLCQLPAGAFIILLAVVFNLALYVGIMDMNMLQVRYEKTNAMQIINFVLISKMLNG